jgi:hypothetical protein
MVYRATDERLARTVLVHLLRPDLQDNAPLRQRFADEAQGLARRTHPALLEVFDSGDIAGRPYMITEEAVGRSLLEALPLRLEQAIQILRQVVGGVATTIATQTPTPPISSQTIILTETGRAVIIEPWWINANELREDLAFYRAPERAQGGPPDERSTVYALGILGYELVGGARPISGANAAELQRKHLQQTLPSVYDLLNGFVPSLAAALTLATARDLDTRTATVQAFARDLAAVEAAAEAPTKQMIRPVPALRDSMREARRTITQRRTQPVAPPLPSAAPSAASAAPVWNAPPPRPVIPPRQAAPPPAQAAPPAQAGLSRDDLRQELRREIRREARRSGCLKFFGRNIILLTILALLAGGCFWGFTFGKRWLTEGAAKTWACSWLPPFGCNLIPGPGGAGGAGVITKRGPTTFITQTTSNVRSSPVLDLAEGNVLARLPQGTRVVAPSPDDITAADGVNWVRIEVDFESRRVKGWVAVDLLQEEVSP